MQTAAQPVSSAEQARGLTLLCGETETGRFPGAIPTSCAPGAVSAYADGSVRSILVVGDWSGTPDPVQSLRAWRRVLEEGGTLVFDRGSDGGAPPFSTAFVLSLTNLVGGFECVGDASQRGREPHAALVLTRRRLAEIRNPLAVLGPALAAAARSGEQCHAELLFQSGVLLLQAGEAELAGSCFERMLRLVPGSAEAHFGLGMALAADERWREALCELECARRLDHSNPELQRWLERARTHVGGPADVVLPAGPPGKWSPAAMPIASPAATGLRL